MKTLKTLLFSLSLLVGVASCSCSEETQGSVSPGNADGAAEASVDGASDATMDAITDGTTDTSADATADAMRTDAMVETCGSFAAGVSPCALAYDHTTATVWVMGCSQSEILAFGTDGSDKGSTATAGESANDVDIDVAPSAFSLGSVGVTEGDLLFINGETGVAEVYRLDTEGADPSEPLITDFGASHVVGGAYHDARGTFFLVQDRQPAVELRNLVAEIDATTGTTINTFSLGDSFSVNYGDLDVCQSTGNLFVVSSDEGTIAEFSPDGAYITEYALPDGVSNSAGIDFDDSTGTLWVSATGGTITCLSGLFCPPT